jgi:PQQ-like domain
MCASSSPPRDPRCGGDLDSFTLQAKRDPHDAGQGGVYTVFGQHGISVIGRDAPGHGSWSRRVRALVGPHWQVGQQSSIPYVGHGVVVLSMSRRVSASQQRRFDMGRRVVVDRGADRTIGLDLRTGRVLWTHDGDELNCPSVAYVESPVRCAFGGLFLFDKRWHGPRLASLRLTVEGFDPATGATTWSVPLAASDADQEARDMYKNSEDPVAGVIVGDELGWVPARSGPRVVAWSDGSSRATDVRSVLLCPIPPASPSPARPWLVGFTSSRSRIGSWPTTWGEAAVHLW